MKSCRLASRRSVASDSNLQLRFSTCSFTHRKSITRRGLRLDDHLGHAVDSTRGLFLLTPRRETQLAAEARSLICLSPPGSDGSCHRGGWPPSRAWRSRATWRSRSAASCSGRCTTTWRRAEAGARGTACDWVGSLWPI
mmetsp:Transcript_46168/g.153046  ORF Transcript_46168/g.153046 Transcript_46168/m.153046 type:complete len:139 (+) Transcript_46168:305-721(+)